MPDLDQLILLAVPLTPLALPVPTMLSVPHPHSCSVHGSLFHLLQVVYDYLNYNAKNGMSLMGVMFWNAAMGDVWDDGVRPAASAALWALFLQPTLMAAGTDDGAWLLHWTHSPDTSVKAVHAPSCQAPVWRLSSFPCPCPLQYNIYLDDHIWEPETPAPTQAPATKAPGQTQAPTLAPITLAPTPSRAPIVANTETLTDFLRGQQRNTCKSRHGICFYKNFRHTLS